MKNVGQQLYSGALSGLATTITLQPLDLLKTRLQQGDGRTHTHHGTMIFRTARDVVKTRGVLGLWRGTNASLIRNVPGVAMYMATLTQLRTVMATSPYFASVDRSQPSNSRSSVLPQLTPMGNLISGAFSRVSVGFILNPFSVLKARYESSMYGYKSLTGAFLEISKQGPHELFRGFLPSALRDAPYAGLFIVFYEGIKRKVSPLLMSETGPNAAATHMISAASAGAISTLATHPFDVIKTKMQVRTEDRYHGLWRTSKTIWQQRGLSGYFDGASLRLTRKVFSSAVGWAVYEGVLLFVHKPHKENKSDD